MSLSEMPPVKITYGTIQDISDEILGGVIRFCRESGYRQNIMMLTFFWSAFLLASKEQLEENGLIEEVQSCYTYSLIHVFPYLREDKERREKVEELRQHYWNLLSTDFTTLRTEAEMTAFFQIANKLNNQDGNASPYLLKPNPQRPFSQISSNVRSNVDCILRQIDNSMMIQHRGILRDFHFARMQSSAPVTSQATTPAPAISHANTFSKKEQKKKSPALKAILIILAIVLGITVIANIAEDSDPKSNYTEEDEDLDPVAEPRSGAILEGKEDDSGSEITVKASSSESCVVKLKTKSGVTRVSFYVRAGDTVTVGVPMGRLYVYFASGDTWYGTKHLFGSKTSYSKDDDLKDFSEFSYTYTLYPVSNGNFSQTPIDEDEF